MVQPINYTTDVLSPIQGYLQGLKFGEGLNTDRLNQAATTQTMGIQREQMDLQLRQYEDAQRARAQAAAAAQANAAAQRAAAVAGRDALLGYMAKVEAGEDTPADLRRAMIEFPGMMDQFQAISSSFSDERKANEVGFGRQLTFALANDNVDAAENLLRTRQQAAEAAGDARGAAAYQAQLLELQADPRGLLMQTNMGLLALMPDDEFDNHYTNILGLGGNAAEPTSGMREYEFARSQGYQGTFEQWKAGGTPQTNINVNTGDPIDTRPITGAPRQDFQRVWDEEAQTFRDVVIPGTETALAMQDAEAKRTNTDTEGQLMMGTTLSSLNLNIAAAEAAEAGETLPVTGLAGDARRTNIGRALTGDDAFDFANRTSQITDSAALAEIQRMRDNSPTGGAVGALTDGERVAIGNAVTALNSSTSAQEYLRAARAYRDLSLDIAYGDGRWQLNDDGTVSAVGGPAQIQPPAEVPQEVWDVMTPEERALFQ